MVEATAYGGGHSVWYSVWWKPQRMVGATAYGSVWWEAQRMVQRMAQRMVEGTAYGETHWRLAGVCPAYGGAHSVW